MRLLTSIEIFPDYSATGLWATYDDGSGHEAIEAIDLPYALPPHVLHKIELMNKVYEAFGVTFDASQTGMMREGSMTFMIWEIYRDLAHHPLQPFLLVPPWLRELFEQERKVFDPLLSADPFFDLREPS